MPTKKIGYSAKRRTSMSSLSRRRQPHLKGYKDGVRIMEKSSKIALGVLFGKPSNHSNKRTSKTNYNYPMYTSSTYKDINDSHFQQLLAFILITIETMLMTISLVSIFIGASGISIIAFFIFFMVFPLMLMSLGLNTF